MTDRRSPARIPGWLNVFALIWFALGAFATVRAAEEKVSVGTVALVIGNAEIERAEGWVPLKKGGELQSGDSIRTGVSGHVHLRFVDGAMVSVRPESRLKIVQYVYDKSNPAASSVKFHLETGVVRAISGAAAEAARDRFRLNTPLVAIGVKGTDFITHATTEGIRALVNQGAIVIAPFDSQCLVDGLGPCATMRARELSDAAGRLALVYARSDIAPSLQPIVGLKGTELSSTGGLASVDVGEVGRTTRLASTISGSVNTDALKGPVTEIVVDPTLFWGRWGAARVGDGLTQSFADAMKGNAVTVGDGYYFLFRRESGLLNTISSTSGTFDFRLTASSAQLVEGAGNIRSAQVTDGSLGINFSTSVFSTRMSVSVPNVGDYAVSASGVLNPATGILIGGAGDTRVSGAVSLDATQAGLLFRKTLPVGILNGATLWVR